ncbi:MAG: hypothetical protein MJ025_03190 [Victivallaceae bacterium]|nr:hypothetical protein [Victivallaceae bacterium]
MDVEKDGVMNYIPPMLIAFDATVLVQGGNGPSACTQPSQTGVDDICLAEDDEF